MLWDGYSVHGDGYSVHGDGEGWCSVSVPMQTLTVDDSSSIQVVSWHGLKLDAH